MKIISLLLLIIAVSIKFDIVHFTFINRSLSRYIFAFSVGLFVFAFIKPHMALFFYNKKKLEKEFINEVTPELLNEKLNMYSVEMLFKPNLFAIKKKAPIIIIDNKILNKLSSKELRFFIFHEYSHIKDNDSLKMQLSSLSALTLIPLCFFIIINIITLPENFMEIIPYIMIFVLLYFIGIMLSFKYKRRIELKCDYYASKYVDKKDIQNAFEKLVDIGTFTYEKRSILSTHPSLDERLSNLNIKLKRRDN